MNCGFFVKADRNDVSLKISQEEISLEGLTNVVEAGIYLVIFIV